MSHRLSVTITQSKIIKRALDAAGIDSNIEPDSPGRVFFAELHGRVTVNNPWHVFKVYDGRYKKQYAHAPLNNLDGVEAVLSVASWFFTEFYGSEIARILSASLMLAIRSEAFITHSDETDSSIDSGDAVDVMYGAVRAIDPTYKVSSCVEHEAGADQLR